MGVYGPDDVAFLLVAGYNLLGYTQELSDDSEAILEVSTTLGDTAEEYTAVGVSKMMLKQRVFYDDTDNATDEALLAALGAEKVVCYGVEGNTLGKHFVGFKGALGRHYNRVARLAELHKAEVDYVGTGAIEEGIILHSHQAETADGDTEGASSQDAGASSASGGSGYLQVSALTLGTATSVTFNIRHSADDITYANLITFTTVTAAPGHATSHQRSTVSGTVNRHLAVSWADVGGTFTSATFMIGFKRS